MIITCPCEKKQFKIDSSLIPQEGRELQCGSCERVWFYKPKNESEAPLTLNENIDSRERVTFIHGLSGVGKTTLAKLGISKCIQDNEGNCRPFSFIALGGSSNGSTLEGHNYTYVGSTWGKIVDTLITSKCMNPIIFIDELDKVSKSEHGKEIIGILTHLVDSTQNDSFQDKYFNGVDLDLSKALFIFSLAILSVAVGFSSLKFVVISTV